MGWKYPLRCTQTLGGKASDMERALLALELQANVFGFVLLFLLSGISPFSCFQMQIRMLSYHWAPRPPVLSGPVVHGIDTSTQWKGNVSSAAGPESITVCIPLS